MILVDTSLLVDHLRAADTQLSAHLERSVVAIHSIVLGVLACGNLKNRQMLLLWKNLPQLSAATDAEALFFQDHKRLWGRGIGYIDLHLLGSVALHAEARLRTRDKNLHTTAAHLGFAFTETGA